MLSIIRGSFPEWLGNRTSIPVIADPAQADRGLNGIFLPWTNYNGAVI